MAKDHYLGVRVDTATKEALRLRAAQQQRTVGQIVRRILEAALGQ